MPLEVQLHTQSPWRGWHTFGIIALTCTLVVGCAATEQPPAAENTPEPASDAQQTGAVEAAGLAFNLPEGWQSEAPASSMRAAQALIPGSGGPGQLTVFFFGVGGGGGVSANLDRWVGQIGDATSEPLREQFESGDYLISTVRHQGTLKASNMGPVATDDQPNHTLLGAVVEGPGGPWYFKATGPDATMSEQADAFRSMLESLG